MRRTFPSALLVSGVLATLSPTVAAQSLPGVSVTVDPVGTTDRVRYTIQNDSANVLVAFVIQIKTFDEIGDERRDVITYDHSEAYAVRDLETMRPPVSFLLPQQEVALSEFVGGSASSALTAPQIEIIAAVFDDDTYVGDINRVSILVGNRRQRAARYRKLATALENSLTSLSAQAAARSIGMRPELEGEPLLRSIAAILAESPGPDEWRTTLGKMAEVYRRQERVLNRSLRIRR